MNEAQRATLRAGWRLPTVGTRLWGWESAQCRDKAWSPSSQGLRVRHSGRPAPHPRCARRWCWPCLTTRPCLATATTSSTPCACGLPRPPMTSTSRTVSAAAGEQPPPTPARAWPEPDPVPTFVPQSTLVATSRLFWTATWLRTSLVSCTPTTMYVSPWAGQERGGPFSGALVTARTYCWLCPVCHPPQTLVKWEDA